VCYLLIASFAVALARAGRLLQGRDLGGRTRKPADVK
jgi:hypothetical protein